MKLYLSTTSPYARLALIAALSGKKENLQLRFVKPWENPSELLDATPFRQIPILKTENSLTLSESLIIAQHLNPQFLTGGYNSAKISFALSLINQAVRYFSLKLFDDKAQYIIKRSIESIECALPHCPELNAQHPETGDFVLAIALSYIELRLEKSFQTTLAQQEKQALKKLQQHPYMRKTHPQYLEKSKAHTVAEL